MTIKRNQVFARCGLLIVALFAIIFLGRETDEQGRSHMVIVNDGWEHYKLGMDVAGGTRLTYKVDYSKYKQVYTDPFAFEQAKKEAETVILKQIDSRISKLGVSDYNAKALTINDSYYIQVELGGVQNIEEAKATIGKTVELEFKIANDEEPTADQYNIRRQRAIGLFNTALENPETFATIAANLQSEDILFTEWNRTPLSQLPALYSDIDRDTIKTGTVYNTLIEGTYQDFTPEQEEQGFADMEGFTMIKLIDVSESPVDQIQPSALVDYLSRNQIAFESEVTATQNLSGLNEIIFDPALSQLRYNLGEVFLGQQAYNTVVYTQIGSGENMQERVQGGDSEGITQEYEGWITANQLTTSFANFVYEDGKEWYTLPYSGGIALIQVLETKQPADKRYETLLVNNASQAQVDQITQALKNPKLYTFQEIFVLDRERRIPALDPKTGAPLDAKHFEIARMSSDQLGNVVTQLSFNEQGGQIFCNITQENIQNQLAIFVGGELVSAPVIQDRICGGSTIIQGDFTGQTCYRANGDTYAAADHREGVQCMVENLNEGALPAALVLTQEEKVSASLGQKALRGVIVAGIVGFIAIFFYMFFLYGIRKAVTSLIVLVGFMMFLLAALKLINYVISMSSLAALILTIGMSVDACILMFERINEEAKKQPLRSAIVDGCKRSRPAIRDGNLSTGLIALLLFAMGVNIFKGFGSMMIITIIIVLLMIVPLTKFLLLLMYPNKKK